MPEEVFSVDVASSMTKLAFATADDPFYKLSTARYYPEALVFNKQGQLLHKAGPDSKEAGPLQYLDDIRDPKLKINDDKKILISIKQMTEPGTMILLTVKMYTDGENNAIGKDDDFKRSWMRLSNEETNQTVDYCLINQDPEAPTSANMVIPEGYQA